MFWRCDAKKGVELCLPFSLCETIIINYSKICKIESKCRCLTQLKQMIVIRESYTEHYANTCNIILRYLKHHKLFPYRKCHHRQPTTLTHIFMGVTWKRTRTLCNTRLWRDMKTMLISIIEIFLNILKLPLHSVNHKNVYDSNL